MQFSERRQPRKPGTLTLKLDGSLGGSNWPLSAACTPTCLPGLGKPRTPTSHSAANTPASPSTHLDILQSLTLQGQTPTGTPTNESYPSLASGASSVASLALGSSAAGRAGELKAVLPEELAKRMRRPKPFLLLDCRPEFMYKMNHIYGAVNVNLTDRVVRRRLHLGKVSVLEVMTSKEAKALYRKRVLKEVVIYDEKTMDWTELPPYDHLQILLNSLKNDGKDPAVLIESNWCWSRVQLVLVQSPSGIWTRVQLVLDQSPIDVGPESNWCWTRVQLVFGPESNWYLDQSPVGIWTIVQLVLVQSPIGDDRLEISDRDMRLLDMNSSCEKPIKKAQTKQDIALWWKWHE
ncbi:putative Dual specificity protein phosphatase 10 [Hypsibius exemplaris]|uniref:Dual specificity protein phosphatase 10 n=1 Tax=Hypsibius exemplaris TaxID=2072580 RepID=A0A1W0WAL7_HYPEX|nr:putative Dual specificity protein phosphatase 10 [Hypsibius exemplaris]